MNLLEEILAKVITDKAVKEKVATEGRNALIKKIKNLSDDQVIELLSQGEEINLASLFQTENVSLSLDTPIEDLELQHRTYYCLKAGKLNTIREVIQTPVHKLLKMRNFGKKSLADLQRVLEVAGYKK